MKLLFDTHAFIWWASAPSKLPSMILNLCKNRENTIFLSVASVWEMQIKLQLGKLKLTLPLQEIINKQIRTNIITELPIQLAHVLELQNLPKHHKDPFDRILIAQSKIESAPLISGDHILTKYPMKVLWNR